MSKKKKNVEVVHHQNPLLLLLSSTAQLSTLKRKTRKRTKKISYMGVEKSKFSPGGLVGPGGQHRNAAQKKDPCACQVGGQPGCGHYCHPEKGIKGKGAQEGRSFGC
jgi:hypothetical protein